MTNVIKNNIPNTVTCLNLFSGCIACVMAFEARYDLALLFIILSAVLSGKYGIHSSLPALCSLPDFRILSVATGKVQQ